MKIYFRILALLYFGGAVLHTADLLNLRLKFSEMNNVWKFWIVYLAIFDLLASIGLWRGQNWGIILFLIIAISQLIAYIGFVEIFANQDPLIIFHTGTLTIFGIMFMIKKLSVR